MLKHVDHGLVKTEEKILARLAKIQTNIQLYTRSLSFFFFYFLSLIFALFLGVAMQEVITLTAL